MPQANKEVAKRWFEEVWNKRRRDAIDEMLAPSAVLYEAGEQVIGPEGFKPFFDRMLASFSDITVTIQDMLAEDELVSVRWTCRMRHTGDGLGMPPTNKLVDTTGITIMRVKDGRLIGGWQNWDMLGVIQQIKGEPRAATYIGGKP